MGVRLPLLGGGSFESSGGGYSSGGGSGLNLFDLQASVGLDASTFNSGIASLNASITRVGLQISTMLTSVQSIASSMQTAFDNANSEVSNASTETTNAVNSIADAVNEGSNKFERFTQFAASAWSTVQNFAGAMWDVGAELVGAAAAVEQDERRFATAFTGVTEEAQQAMMQLANDNNIHYSRLRVGMSDFYMQFSNAGIESAEVMGMTTGAMQMAADAAAAYGINLDDATRRIASFLRGNSEAGESIGLFTSAVTRDAYANQLYQQQWKDLTEAQREYALYRLAQDTYAGRVTGSAQRYSDSYANALANFNASVREVQAKFGEPIMNAITPVLEELFAWATSPEGTRAINAVANLIGLLVDALSDLFIDLANWALNEDNVENFTQVIDTISDVLSWLFGFDRNKATPTPATSSDFVDPTGNAEALASAHGDVRVGDISGYGHEYFSGANRDSGVINQGAIDVAQANYNAMWQAVSYLAAYANTPFGETTDELDLAFIDAVNALVERELLTREQADAMENLGDAISARGGLGNVYGEGVTAEELFRMIMEGSGEDDTDSPGENIQQLLQQLLNEQASTRETLPGAIAAALNGIFGGLSVQVDGATLGSIVGRYMARNARNGMYTGTNA